MQNGQIMKRVRKTTTRCCLICPNAATITPSNQDLIFTVLINLALASLGMETVNYAQNLSLLMGKKNAVPGEIHLAMEFQFTTASICSLTRKMVNSR